MAFSFNSFNVPKLESIIPSSAAAATNNSLHSLDNLPTANTSNQNIMASLTPPVFSSDGAIDPSSDLRVKISLPPQAGVIFYNDTSNTVMAPLAKTFGFIFPIQPAVTMTYSAEYQKIAPTHSNFPYYHFTSSELQPISLQGDFPVRTAFDAQYVNAGILFLRSLTRMFNSRDGKFAGAPPMVARLKGLGFNGLDNIPVVLTNVTVQYADNIDYLTYQPFSSNPSEVAKMPINVNIQIQATPIFSRNFITNTYSTTAFSTGSVRLLGKTVLTTSPAQPNTNDLNLPELGNTASGNVFQQTLNPDIFASAGTSLNLNTAQFQTSSVTGLQATPGPSFDQFGFKIDPNRPRI